MTTLKNEVGVSINVIMNILSEHGYKDIKEESYNTISLKGYDYETMESKIAQDEIIVIHEDETITRYLIRSNGSIETIEIINDSDEIEDNLKWYMGY